MKPSLFLFVMVFPALAGCVQSPAGQTAGPQRLYDSAPAETPVLSAAAQSFVQVVQRVEPVAERFCRQQRPDLNCDFRVIADDTPGAPPNAYHRLDPQNGQPVIGFNLALIAEARNADELAFVLGHEAGHHIAGHLGRQKTTATAGALIFGGLAAVSGVGALAIQSASEIGAAVGARQYSKDFELEADVIGALIAAYAGYDAERGAAFFDRMPNPGDQFLGSHPPNEARVEVVARTMRDLRAGRY